LVDTPTPYIGILGPRKKTLKMIEELHANGKALSSEQLNKIYGPTGLDTGAENGEEIALSVCAEINAVINGRNGSSLRLKEEPIHQKSSLTKSLPQ
jgi:xanthine dehydrogenase accessory factor